MLARVSKKKGRGRAKKLEWQYSVRWKGYGPDEDTWEPAASFADSEQFIDNFWKQAKTGGRDYSDLSLFKVGEEFFPIGPPPRKRKRASTGETSKPTASPSKRRQIDREDSPPATHPPIDPPTPQEANEPVSSRINRHQSSEVPGTPQPPLSDDIAESSPRLHDTCSTDEISRPEPSPPVTPEPVRTAPPRRKGPPAIPEHRSRASKPLVKMVDDPQLSQLKNAIPAKARAAARGSTNESPSSSTKTPRISGSRAGPGRSSRGLRTPSSSLLTFKDGSLQSVKRQQNGESSRALASQEPPPFAAVPTDWAVEESFPPNEIPGLTDGRTELGSPPSGAELLHLAGLDETAQDLPDYQDVPQPPPAQEESTDEQQPSAVDQTLQGSSSGVMSALFQKFNAAKATLFPSTPSDSPAEHRWRHSDASNTIFGPMASGSSEHVLTTSSYTTFFLSFDSNTSIRVYLSAMPQGTSSLDQIIQSQSTALPGKFYQSSLAHQLVNSLRACGPSAKVLPVEADLDDKQRADFDKFKGKLKAGDLFVQPVGKDTLVLCAPENVEVAQRLNFPKAYLADSDQVLTTLVTIENIDTYASLIEHADANRW